MLHLDKCIIYDRNETSCQWSA